MSAPQVQFVNQATPGGGCAQLLVMVVPLQAQIDEYDAVWYPPNQPNNPYVFSSLTGGPYDIEVWSTTQLSYGGVTYSVPAGSGAWLIAGGGGAGACNTAAGTAPTAWGWISQPNKHSLTGSVNDPAGHGVAGEQVLISGPNGDVTVTTTANGSYVAVLDPAIYTVSMPGTNANLQAGGAGEVTECSGVGTGSYHCTDDLTIADGSASFVVPLMTLSITAIRFEQLNVATPVVEPVPSSGTIDGNKVDVIATLHNSSAVDVQTDVRFGSPIDQSASVGITRSGVTVPAGGSVDIDEVLDTNGLAWADDGSPQAQRSIKITLGDGTNATATLTVRPKPVILVHGLWSSAVTWSWYVGGGGFLAKENVLWRGYAVGDGQAPGVMNTSPFDSPGNTIEQNAVEEAKYIQGVRENADAEHVDIVAHSMGGLISRYYIQEFMPGLSPGDSRQVVSHLVMMGTPNEGSNCAYDALGAEMLLGIGSASPVNQPLLQLAPTTVALFNTAIHDMRGVPFSSLAGIGFGIAASCTMAGSPFAPGLPNDGLVTIPSAWWTIADHSTEPLIHTEETGSTLAFDDWVKPHLALGPTATGGGTYVGPLIPGARPRSMRSAVTPVLTASSDRAPRTGSTTKRCLTATAAPHLSAGSTATLRASATTAIAIRVPAHAGTLEATILAEPTVTTRLVDPLGHVTEAIAAGSTAASGLFRTLTARAPRAGTWYLDATSSVRNQIVVAVLFGHPPLQIKLSVAPVGSKGALLFTGQVSGTGAAHANVTVELLVPGHGPITLHLKKLHGRTATYAARSGPLTNPAPATVLIRASAASGSTSSTFQLQACGK